QALFARGLITLKEQIYGLRVRKFRSAPEAAVAMIEQFDRRIDHVIHDPRIEIRACRRKCFGFRDGFRKLVGGAFELVALVGEGVRDGLKNSRKTRTAHRILRRKICAAEKRTALWRQKTSERPAALPRNSAHGRLIARVHIGPLIAIHFYRNKVAIDEGRGL